MKKNITLAFIAGILLTIFFFHAYTVYKLRAALLADEKVLRDVVTYLNQNQTSTQTPSVNTVTPAEKKN